MKEPLGRRADSLRERPGTTRGKSVGSQRGKPKNKQTKNLYNNKYCKITYIVNLCVEINT